MFSVPDLSRQQTFGSRELYWLCGGCGRGRLEVAARMNFTNRDSIWEIRGMLADVGEGKLYVA